MTWVEFESRILLGNANASTTVTLGVTLSVTLSLNRKVQLMKNILL